MSELQKPIFLSEDFRTGVESFKQSAPVWLALWGVESWGRSPESALSTSLGYSLGHTVHRICSTWAAEVIKIEPPSGDISRRAFPRQGEISGYYAQQNAGKRNISIDLNVAGAREIALRLCDDADILVEKLPPRHARRLRAGVLRCRRTQSPRHLCLDQWLRTTRPWRGRSAYAPTVQAETGITKLSNAHFGTQPDRARSDSLSHGDIYAGLHATIAILAALN